MFYAWIITALVLVFYSSNSYDRAKKEFVQFSSIAVLILTWTIYFYLGIDKHLKFDVSLLNLLVIPFFLVLMYYVKQETKQKTMQILAKPQTYWPISPGEIRSYYADREVEKTDRIEVRKVPHLVFYRTYGNDAKLLSGNVIYDLAAAKKDPGLTTIKSTKELNQSRLYGMIFKKLKDILKYKEIDVNLEQLLHENDNKAEYFLMDLWEKYTQDINIGTANLEVVARSTIERELIGALDNLDMECVKRTGLPLYVGFMRFKNRIPDTIEEETEETNIEPKNQEGDPDL